VRYSGGGAYTICGKLAETKVPLVLSIVGAILAMVKWSLDPDPVDELRDNDGRDDRDPRDELLRISSMSSSDSLSGAASSGSLIATHCSTNVLNEMCRLSFVSDLSVGEVTGTAPPGDTLPEMGIRGGDR
jgi:hypothetical protein